MFSIILILIFIKVGIWVSHYYHLANGKHRGENWTKKSLKREILNKFFFELEDNCNLLLFHIIPHCVHKHESKLLCVISRADIVERTRNGGEK